jgi:hypothetical protein
MGRRHQVLGQQAGQGLIELGVVAAWPLVLWLLISKAGAPAQVTVIAGLVALFVLDKIFKFEAVLPIMTPVLLIGGMTTGLSRPPKAPLRPASGPWCWVSSGTRR